MKVAESDLKINLILWAMHTADGNDEQRRIAADNLIAQVELPSTKDDLRYYLRAAANILNPPKEPK